MIKTQYRIKKILAKHKYVMISDLMTELSVDTHEFQLSLGSLYVRGDVGLGRKGTKNLCFLTKKYQYITRKLDELKGEIQCY